MFEVEIENDHAVRVAQEAEPLWWALLVQLLPVNWGIVILVLCCELIGLFEFITSSLVVAEETVGLLKYAL